MYNANIQQNKVNGIILKKPSYLMITSTISLVEM